MNRDLIEREYVVSKIAQRIHLKYLDSTGKEPWKNGKAAPWAYEYAEVAVDILGWDEDALKHLEDAP